MFNEENELDFDENAAIEDDEADEENGLGERERIIPDINLFRAFTRKRKIINFCFNNLIQLSFISTLIYNVLWIFIFKKYSFQNSINLKIFIACFLNLIKGFIILFIPIIICGQENATSDFRFVRLFINMCTSLLVSYQITNMIKNNTLEVDNNSFFNNEIYFWINLYYKYEYFYLISIPTIVAVILIAVLIIIIKEMHRVFG